MLTITDLKLERLRLEMDVFLKILPVLIIAYILIGASVACEFRSRCNGHRTYGIMLLLTFILWPIFILVMEW